MRRWQDVIVASKGTADLQQQLASALEACGAGNYARSTAFLAKEAAAPHSGRDSFGVPRAKAAPAPVLAAVQQRWQRLVMERLKALQSLLPAVHMVGRPRTQAQLQAMRDQGARLPQPPSH